MAEETRFEKKARSILEHLHGYNPAAATDEPAEAFAHDRDLLAAVLSSHEYSDFEPLERWAVRVLDAWADKNPDLDPFRTGRGEPNEEDRWCCWTMGAPGEKKYFYAATPDLARIAVARALVAEDPSLPKEPGAK